MSNYLNHNDLYFLFRDNTEKTYHNVICFNFDINNHNYVIFYIDENNNEISECVNDKTVKYFHLA